MDIAKKIEKNRFLRFLKLDWGKRSVIGIPYIFLIVFFSLPFLVVLKLSVSEADWLARPTAGQMGMSTG